MTYSVDEISIRTTQAGSGAIENSFFLSVCLFVSVSVSLSKEAAEASNRSG
jgi:hypothetical protein